MLCVCMFLMMNVIGDFWFCIDVGLRICILLMLDRFLMVVVISFCLWVFIVVMLIVLR